jgi:hypothetical protein
MGIVDDITIDKKTSGEELKLRTLYFTNTSVTKTFTKLLYSTIKP